MNPRLPWLWLFIGVNLVAAVIMLITGELIGDLHGHSLHSPLDLLVALILVVTSYYLLLNTLFNFLAKIRVKPVAFKASELYLGNKIGVFLASMQILYILFNIINNVNIAGSNNVKTTGAASLFWVLFPVDALFLIYYGSYRESKFFYINLLIWIISNVMRGWAGIFLTIFFLEWCRSARNKKLSIFKVGFAAISVLLLYPIILNFKWIIRAASGVDVSAQAILDGLTAGLLESEYLSLIGDGLTHIVGRLQTTSMMVDVIRLSDLLQSKFSAGEFAPFWKEGLHGILYDRIFFSTKEVFIGVAFTSYETFNFNYLIGDWNVSLGYPSWFFIAPNLILFYILYTFLLASASIFIYKKIGLGKLSLDVLWYTWLVYLLAPWFLPFTSFIYSAGIFLLIKIFISKLSNISFKSANTLQVIR